MAWTVYETEISRSDRVCGDIYTYLVTSSLFKSLSVRKSVGVNVCWFSSNNQSPDSQSSRCLHYFPAAMSLEQRAPPTWRFHTGLCKFAQNISTNIKFGNTQRPKTWKNVYFTYLLVSFAAVFWDVTQRSSQILLFSRQLINVTWQLWKAKWCKIQETKLASRSTNLLSRSREISIKLNKIISRSTHFLSRSRHLDSRSRK